MLHGVSLGGIKFAINGPLWASSNCHCRMCRKQHGTAFRVERASGDFKWVQGEELVTLQIFARLFPRFFRVCGSPVITAQRKHKPRGPGAPSGGYLARSTTIREYA